MKKTITAIITAILLAGCATSGANYRPMVDTRPGQNYEQDLAECQAYAHTQAGAADGAVSGAVVGALLGVAFAAIGGGSGFRNEMAGIGALTGALQGAGQASGGQQDVIRRCLAGRGYSVLN